MKRIYIILGSFIILISLIIFIYNKNNKEYYIDYNGLKLAMSVNGESVRSLPTGNYFLVRYECNKGTKLSWNRDTGVLTSENTNVNDNCYLEFKSSPDLYDLVKIGDYIEYTGNNGCTGNQCNGWNAEQTNTDIYENFGFCFEENQKFYTYGWRVLYKDDNSVFIVSAGSPECVTGTEGDSTATRNNLNETALKYCNEKYVSGGVCEKGTNQIHAFNGKDFYKFTSQYYGNINARRLYYYDGVNSDAPICSGNIKDKYCGINNDVIDNGGHYWFDNPMSKSGVVLWTGYDRAVSTTSQSVGTRGVRPVTKLDSTIKATGGLGTMENPYTISERVTE